jgi:hypothetical protein
MVRQAVSVVVLASEAAGHGHMTFPPNRAGGNISAAALVRLNPTTPYQWFSQPMVIPGEPTLNEPQFRTYNVDVKDGTHDWSRKMPWRAPGQAPVRGSGCGVAGGSPVKIPNGGDGVYGFEMGADGLDLPEKKPTEWQIGGVATVGFALLANHGGGYSWRLCKKNTSALQIVTEECFQENTLPFHGTHSWLQYIDEVPSRDAFLHPGTTKYPKVEIPRVVVPGDQVHPTGSHWARNPIPSCKYCDQSKCGTLLPNLTEPVTLFPHPEGYAFGGDAWFKQELCAQECSGFSFLQCPPGMTQFEEPAPGISGYVQNLGPIIGDDAATYGGLPGFSYNVMDEVEIPADLQEGDYLLSWRWDCEQSPQIWQQCADIRLVKAEPSILI